MTITYFVLLVCLTGLFFSHTAVMQWQVIWCLFGSSAAAVLTGLGGANVTPTVMFVPFLLVRAIAEKSVSGCVRQLAFPGAGFWLSMLAVWGVISAQMLPRLFRGSVQILNVDRFVDSMAAYLYPLQPASGNITQPAYAIVGTCAYMAMRGLLAREGRIEKFRDAVLIVAALNAVAAAIDLVQASFNLPDVLAYVRNGNYAITHQTLAGLKRIAGTFAEPATFTGFTLPIFAFCFSLWRRRERAPFSGALALISFLLLLRSTSSTAYAGLAGYGLCVLIIFARSALKQGRIPRFGTLLAISYAALVILGLVVLAEEPYWQKIVEVANETIFGKLESHSGIERGNWNKLAWSNFVDTYGVGVGLGSARASSYPLVILSNLGILGAFLYAAFVLCIFRGAAARTASAAAVRDASRHAVLASLITATISATVFDLGVDFYLYAAAATVVTQTRRMANTQGNGLMAARSP